MVIDYKAVVEELELALKKNVAYYEKGEKSSSGQVAAQASLDLFLKIKNKYSMMERR